MEKGISWTLVLAIILVCLVWFFNIMGWDPLAYPAPNLSTNGSLQIIKQAEETPRGEIKIEYTYTTIHTEHYTLDEIDYYIQIHEGNRDKAIKAIEELRKFVSHPRS